MRNEQTFVIIKPDAIERHLVGRIINRFEDRGFRIQHIEKRHKNADWCRLQYEHIFVAQCRGEFQDPVYSRLEMFMICRPTIGIILSGPAIIERVREMIGTTNVLDAKPGTIRGDWGRYSGPYNLIHSSDSTKAVENEIALYFDKETDQ